MECRLCLCSVSAESSVSIHDDPDPLVQRIWTCCHLQVMKGDSLPDVMCLSCVKSLVSLSSFRDICLKSDEMSKLRLNDCPKIKPEEVILEDLIWEDVTSSGNRTKTVHDIETPPTESLLPKAADEICSTHSESSHEINSLDPSVPMFGLQLTQQNRTPFECGVCLKSFTLKPSLVRHSRTHMGEKPFKCDICSKSFTRQYSLAVHLKSHTEKNPHKCNICLKIFTQKDDLVMHRKSHPIVQPFKCDICSKSFTRKYGLTIHSKSHTGNNPYTCNVCLKTFPVKNYLRRHLESHSGDKPYKCDICLKTFAAETYLKQHSKSHSKDKLYQCDICLKSYTRRGNLPRYHVCTNTYEVSH
ncbi:uncharacterized protein LOC143912009 [Arctopsyche grandis]|uniref:uncharacterized protein LOC143912009 n=1 Tax=Arctopsyche grandis TaxID=121162 RepID=UPI00406D75AB